MLTGLNNKLYVDNRSYVNTKGTIKYGQSRETDIQNKKNITIFDEDHYAQTNTNNVNKTRVFLESGGKDQPNNVFMPKFDSFIFLFVFSLIQHS